MGKFADSIRKMAQTEELNQKIQPPAFKDKPDLPSRRGIGLPTPTTSDVCHLLYTTRDNSYDIGAILAGTAGPILNDKCDHLDTITGLHDFDTAQNSENYGGEVFLVIQVDGVFT